MKYLFSLLTLAMLAVATPSFADTVEVDITKLSSQQLQAYQEMKAMAARSAASTALENLTPEKVDRYAQMGKGLGIAINEGLGAVTKNVESFSQTSAGKWIMVLVTWKVMGEDAISLTRTAVQYLIGGVMLIVGVPFWIWLVRRNCVQRPIASVEKLGFWSKKITYADRSEPLHADYIFAYGACFLIYLGATAAITFLH
jgi:hypothetical protein